MTLEDVLKGKSVGEAELKVLSINKHLLSAKDLKKYFGEGNVKSELKAKIAEIKTKKEA